MHILIAPNAFKNSLSAGEAAVAIKKGFLKSKLACTCECFPIGDGGDGTGQLIVKKCEGVLVECDVQNPLGNKITTAFGLIDDGKTAVIEMASASGLRLLKGSERNPLQATSYGTGELIKHALDKSVRKIILCIGGSATVDGGTGILEALGVQFLDAAGKKIVGSPASLVDLASINIELIDPRISDCEVIILCDVENKLLGASGAAFVFGPQKGASADDVKKLEAALARFASVIAAQFKKDVTALTYGGAAGGVAAGLYALLQANLVNGIEYFLQLTGFEKVLANADILVTGEGSIDEQTLQGKGPIGIAMQAKSRGLPVVVLAGKVPLERSVNLQRYFDVLIPIGNEPADLKTALEASKINLERTAQEVGNLLALNPFINKKTI